MEKKNQICIKKYLNKTSYNVLNLYLSYYKNSYNSYPKTQLYLTNFKYKNNYFINRIQLGFKIPNLI